MANAQRMPTPGSAKAFMMRALPSVLPQPVEAMLTMNAPCAARAHARRRPGRPPCPAIGIVDWNCAFQATVILQGGQAARQRGQRTRHQCGMGLHAEQVFVQRLVEQDLPSWRIMVSARVRVQRIARIAVGLALRFVLDTRVMMIGQHQAHARDASRMGPSLPCPSPPAEAAPAVCVHSVRPACAMRAGQQATPAGNASGRARWKWVHPREVHSNRR